MAIVRVLCPHCRAAAHIENDFDGKGWHVVSQIGCKHLYVDGDNYGFTITDADLSDEVVVDPLVIVDILREGLTRMGRCTTNLRIECAYRGLDLGLAVDSLDNYEMLLKAELDAFENVLKL